MIKLNKYQGSTDENIKNFSLLLYALLIGLFAGLVGALFRIALSYVERFRDNIYNNTGDAGFISWLWPVLFAITGISVALFLVRKYAPEASGSGVREIEGALDGIRPMRWKRILPIKFIASLFSLGSGLLLGREGPTIQISANIGKMVNDMFGRSDTKNNPLVFTGAAGLASAFNAPFAGVIFIIEEMHGHFKFNFYMVFPSPNIFGLWLFIVLGLIFSVIGYLYNTTSYPIIYTGVFVGLVIAIISIFLPMLTLGMILGMLFGTIMQNYFPNLISHPGVFAIAGMAGIFAATVRAPLTGLVLAIEMTSNYELILPLIVTTVTASVFTALLGNDPIYATLLKRTLKNIKHR